LDVSCSRVSKCLSYTENGHKLRISGKENEDSDKIGE